MNRNLLEQLLINRVALVNKAESALTTLDEYCQKNWSMTFHEALDVKGMQGDHIVEWLDYGNSSAKLNDFIKFMDEASKKQSNQKTVDRNCSP